MGKQNSVILREARFDMRHATPGDCHLSDFARLLADRHKLSLDDYPALHRWSVKNREAFWQDCFEFTDIICQQPATQVLKKDVHFWQDQWFPDCKLNYAENLLRFRDQHTALIFRDEPGNTQSLSYQQLYQQVSQMATWLLIQGVKTGDRVAGFAANRIETVVAMLATASIGGIWSSCSPDFGVNGILDRFSQIEPRVLFAVSSHCYAGRVNEHSETLTRLMAGLPSLKHVVILPQLYGDYKLPTATHQCQITAWQHAMADKTDHPGFAPLDFNHPLFIMYSSGTTGVPKCIVHGTGGTVLQHRKEHHLHLNLKRNDVLFYFTTCGWMMWNWLIGGLASGATLVLYDGSPFHPQPSVLFDLAAETRVSIFGTSARYLAAAEKAGIQPAVTHELPAMHTLLSTGSPLSAEGFDYVYRDVKADISLQSISGGTDIISCFVLGNPVQAIHRGEIQCAGLGMDVAVFNDSGEPIAQEKGELVCRQSFPSMPTGFWNDKDDKKYKAAYFERFPGIWTHGDYAELTINGGWIIYGRSDTVLNPGGVRIGTAEIYRQVEQIEAVQECVAVGQEWESDVRIILFVRLGADQTLTDDLISSIRQQIRQGASPRHIPARILQVHDIPRTLNGKIAETAVRETIHNRPVKNKDALANPQSLIEFEQLTEELKK
jgi:acetoacetyl-CoA synthetase